MDQNISSMEAKVASELSFFLEHVTEEAEFTVEPSAEICNILELYIPEQLSHHYSEWTSESLDGFFVVSARKIGLKTAELAGLCILMSDQTLTPFFIRLALTSSHDSIASYQVYLGEPGGGRLGISGSPYGTSPANKFIANIIPRLDYIKWSYTIKSDVEFDIQR